MPFSVVVPLYNKKAFVARCLRSVLDQTHADFELLVVDDGSTDGGELEVAKFDDGRLRLIRQPNQGVSVARNTGVSAARHEFVLFLDADDTWEAGLIEAMSRLVQAHPDAGVYACGTRKVFADGHAQTPALEGAAFEGNTAILRDYCQTFVDLGQSPFSNSSFGVRKALFQQAGGYTAGVKLTEDSDLWVRLAFLSTVALDPQPLANYFVETENNTRVQVQAEDYQVIKTLSRALASGQVPPHLRLGAARLLALQKHSQVKRLILLGHPAAAWQRLLDRDVWARRPLGSLLLALAASLPPSLFRQLRELGQLRQSRRSPPKHTRAR